MPTMLEIFREAVREAIAESHAAGLPVFQGIDGYLVAIYPDGRRVKLQKLGPASEHPLLRHGASDTDHPRRTERRRKDNLREQVS